MSLGAEPATAAVTIIDSGGANLASLQIAFARLGAEAVISSDAATIERASRVVLPGVGSARDAMTRLRTAGLDSVLRRLRQPILGVCLGMQLLFESSEEGSATCLGILPGAVRRMPATPELPVPHMGWNTLDTVQPDPLLTDIPPGAYFYFVHSYAVAPDVAVTLATSTYRLPLAAVVGRDNVRGVQFHPERSGSAGARLLSNFLRMS